MRVMKFIFHYKWLLFIATFIFITAASAQTTFPVNGVADPSQKSYAFINATIVKDANTTLSNATMIIRERKIISVGNNIPVPKDAVTIDCKGKYIYPSFIDIYSDYGIQFQNRLHAMALPLHHQHQKALKHLSVA